jgi:hypothetical protein
MSYEPEHKARVTHNYRTLASSQLSEVSILVDSIERSFKEKFGVVNPYREI